MPDSLAGQHVELEWKLMWKSPSQLRRARQAHYKKKRREVENTFTIKVPEGQRTGGVPQEAYLAYREGLQSYCDDVVIYTLKPDGTPAVLAIKRGKAPFRGKWWMQGGAARNYISAETFVADRAFAEINIRPEIEAKIGLFRTADEEIVADTTQLCFVGFVPYAALVKAVADRDHTAWRLLTIEDLDNLPLEEMHQYPDFVFRLVLKTVPVLE